MSARRTRGYAVLVGAAAAVALERVAAALPAYTGALR
jgi:hypothetical protein